MPDMCHVTPPQVLSKYVQQEKVPRRVFFKRKKYGRCLERRSRCFVVVYSDARHESVTLLMLYRGEIIRVVLFTKMAATEQGR